MYEPVGPLLIPLNTHPIYFFLHFFHHLSFPFFLSILSFSFLPFCPSLLIHICHVSRIAEFCQSFAGFVSECVEVYVHSAGLKEDNKSLNIKIYKKKSDLGGKAFKNVPPEPTNCQ